MPACPVCEADQWARQWDILCRCQQCGFVRAAELPDEQESNQLYTAEYFQGQEYGDYLADREVHRRNFAARLRDMERLAGPLKSVFEIGCAYGLWLELLSERGIRAAGIDISSEAVRYATEQLGQQASQGNFLQAPLAAGEFEAFCLWDTIEHLSDPSATIERAAQLLPEGGWLFLTTGDIGSRMARWRGRRWRMIHPPTHLHYFSRATIKRLLARHGLTVVEIRAVGVYRTVHSVLSSLAAVGKGVSRGIGGALATTLPQRLQKRVGAWVNLGDIMFVAAQKR